MTAEGDGYLGWAGQDLAVTSGTGSLPAGYTSPFTSWFDKSGVRSRPHHQLGTDGGEVYFSPELVPTATHPLVAERGEQVVSGVLVRRLYDYLHFTTELEQTAVIPVVSQIARGRAGFELPTAMRADAYAILTDEAWHAQTSYDLIAQVEERTGVLAGALVAPQFQTGLETVRARLPAHLRGLEALVFAIVSETLISATLVALPRDTRLPRCVRDVIVDHAVDEGRHHAYFAALLTRLWPRLSAAEARAVGVEVPAMIEAFLMPDTAALADGLRDARLSPAGLSRVLADIADEREVTAQVAAAATPTVRRFEQVGALEDPAIQEAFEAAGLLGLHAEAGLVGRA